MNKSRYDWHREMLGLPSTTGALIFGMAVYGWWFGIFLMLAVLALFNYPYRAYFSTVEGHPRRGHIGTNLLFVFVQISFWGVLFALLQLFKHAPAI